MDVGGAVGRDGYLYVVRMWDTVTSTVELISGEIGDDVTHYLVSSEQTPSALVLGVFVGAEGYGIWGLLIQVLPKAARDETLIQTLESRVAALSGYTALQAGLTLPEFLNSCCRYGYPTETQLVRFHCGCSFDRVLGALKMLGKRNCKT